MKSLHPDHVYIIAEAGVNHNGQRELAFALIDAAAQAGADAVKFQTFNAKKLASNKAPKAIYQKQTTNTEESQLEMLSKLELPRAWHCELQKYAHSKGIEFLSTAFDLDSLQFLYQLNIPVFKVPSGELTNGPLLWRFARLRKPLILSTGMATLSEIEQALAIVVHALRSDKEPTNMTEVWKLWSEPESRHLLKDHVSLLHCTSLYPTPNKAVNLKAMNTLSNAFGLRVGYSDHTDGNLIPVAAVALGATIIEKHFTTNRNLPGPDHKASLEPNELRQMVEEIRAITEALGNGHKAPQPDEWDTRLAARQHVVAARRIAKNTTLTRDDLTTARTGGGKSACELWQLVGTTATQTYEAGEAFVD